MSSSSQLTQVCQRCCNPLKLSQDFGNQQGTRLQALADALRPEKEDERMPSTLLPVRSTGFEYPRYVVPANPPTSTGESLTGLQQNAGPAFGLDHRQKVNACLFDVLSGRTEIDHPLCQECADTLLTAEQQILEFQQEELDCLRSYLSHLEEKAARAEAKLVSRQTVVRVSSTGGEPDQTVDATRSDDLSDYETAISEPVGEEEAWPNPTAQFTGRSRQTARSASRAMDEGDSWLYESSGGEEEVESAGAVETRGRRKGHHALLQTKVDELQSVLSKLLSDGARLEEQIRLDTAELERHKIELDGEQAKYNNEKQELLEAEEELFSLEARVNQAKSQLKRLQHTNVLNTAFPIWYDGHIGVINGLHLGLLPNRPIAWEEINAAWGQCALLLQCIAKKLDHTFTKYRIIPMGSQSKVVELANQREHPLFYSSGGMRYLSPGKFDTAMVYFLRCVGQVQLLMETSTNVQLTYRIEEGGKIRDSEGQRTYSIKWSGNSEENWTKALKMMLINLKWIIAGLSARRLRQHTATPVKPQTTPTESTGNEPTQQTTSK